MRAVLDSYLYGRQFSHGTNDGQKSVGLIMLTIIGLFPAVYALNPEAGQSLSELPNIAREVEPLVERYGNDRKDEALKAAKALEGLQGCTSSTGVAARGFKARARARRPARSELRHGQGAFLAIRDDLYELIAQLNT